MPQSFEGIGLHLPSLIAYTINFILLLVILHWVAYRPFLRFLAQRTERIERGLAEAEEIERIRTEVIQEREREIEAARAEAREIMEGASLRAQAEVEQGRLKGRQEAAAYLRQARQRVEEEKRTALREASEASRDLVFLAAEKALRQAIDRQLHHETVEAAIHEIAASGWPHLARPASRFGRIVTARPLTAEEMSEIQQAVNATSGQPLYLHSSTDPSLLGGLLLSVGDTVVDASVSGRLRQLYHQMKF
jgi:ATP synthase F0 subunit b